MTSYLNTIRFSTDSKGRNRAHYWGIARRWLPISVEKAELWLATGKGVLND